MELVWILIETSQLQKDIWGTVGETWVFDVIKELVLILISVIAM